jgi:hypothetical protein
LLSRRYQKNESISVRLLVQTLIKLSWINHPTP